LHNFSSGPIGLTGARIGFVGSVRRGQFPAPNPAESSILRPKSNVTRLIEVAADLRPLIHDELPKLAAARKAAEAPDETLRPIALVHEAYLRLVGPMDGLRWDGRDPTFVDVEARRRIAVASAPGCLWP
jgi:hypothetical protein